MSRKHKVYRIIVLLGAFLITSSASAEEPRRGRAGQEVGAEAQAAVLAASLPRREVELALRSRNDVLAEVKRRAAELGVAASAEELTDLLGQRAHLELGVDKCRLAKENVRGCRSLEAALARVEESFREKAGLSTREFRTGRLAAGAPDDIGLRNVSEASTIYTCTCAFTVYSSNRWMNRYWGLECKGHASHGVCSNNVDSGHSPGSGAMTGEIDVYFGANQTQRECPDDHYTCFRGPSTEHPGQWGNTCNCDTWHSQSYNPYGSWYGGDLTDAVEVAQFSTPWLSANGPCNGASVGVKEYIDENDPWCCDDPMGDLIAVLPLQEGTGSVSAQASAQNCNGGSQSGVYPNCGSFGATLRVAYVCQTTEYTPEPGTSCLDSCYVTPPDHLCSCEPGCLTRGDCCNDFRSLCCAPESPPSICI